MSEFWIFFEKGLRHILDINAYDHVLFLIALTVPYAFKEWTRLLLLVTVFTVGHTLSLLLAVFGILFVKANLVEFLIPISILIVAFFNLFTAGKSAKKESVSVVLIVTLFFGILHGLGFSGYFTRMIGGAPKGKMLPLLEFSLGIEAAQILVVFVVLILSYIVQTVFRFSKRDWTLVMSSFVIGVVLPLIIHSKFWLR